MPSTYLQNPSSGASSTTERRTLTFSFWVKRCSIGATQYMFSGYNNASYYNGIIFNSGDHLRVFQMAGSTTEFNLKTTRRFREMNNWYHIVVAFDTTDATSSNRIKIYVNGVQETAFDTASYPSQNHNTYFGMTSGGDGYPTYIGGNPSGSYFDGLMADVYLVGGTALTPSTFGETDSDTGEWKPNTNPTITYGSTAGVNSHLNFENASNLGEDTSGNNNDFTVATGTLIQTQDCPSHVFPILNQHNPQSTGYTFDGLGSLSVTGNTGDAWRSVYATFGASSGKYYWEQKITNFTGLEPHYIGIVSDDQVSQSNYDSSLASRGYFYIPTGDKRNNNTQTSYGNSWTTGDIVGIALDLDNSKIFFSKNGVWQNSGDPANGTNPAFTITSGYTYIPVTSTYYNLNRYDMNFGNGYFGTTAIASEGTNASGIGKFEYDVPTGFTALSTKGLNQ